MFFTRIFSRLSLDFFSFVFQFSWDSSSFWCINYHRLWQICFFLLSCNLFNVNWFCSCLSCPALPCPLLLYLLHHDMLSLLRLLAKLLLEMLISKCSQRPDDHSGAAHRRLEYRLRPRQLAVALVIRASVHAPSSICLRNASFRCLHLLTVCCLPCHSMLLL